MKVLFNASVILAGLYSINGASGELLKMVERREIQGVISELIFNEAVRHADKIGLNQEEMVQKVWKVFKNITQSPELVLVEKYLKKVIDGGDAHVLASADREKCNILVTLDKKHLLVLKGKIRGLTILSPGELLSGLRKK